MLLKFKIIVHYNKVIHGSEFKPREKAIVVYRHANKGVRGLTTLKYAMFMITICTLSMLNVSFSLMKPLKLYQVS